MPRAREGMISGGEGGRVLRELTARRFTLIQGLGKTRVSNLAAQPEWCDMKGEQGLWEEGWGLE